ncbi:thiamine ABC transporter, permease protein [SAR116 cluster alpha proteobacterium HIMB100]|nr:thiamine ABC transporter, permease protein [SAR116 cluster alpha proteobacterium HIMB100]
MIHAPHPALLASHKAVLRTAIILASLIAAGTGLLVSSLYLAAPSAGLAWSVLSGAQTWAVILGASGQAFTSAALSVILGMTAARALHRRGQFFGRGLFLSLSFMAMIVPTTVAAIGLVQLWGRNGAIRQFADGLFGQDIFFPAYGLEMVILAHVLFNAPLVMRVGLAALSGLPEHHWRLSAQLGFTRLAYFRFVEWPCLKLLVPALFSLIFLLCFTSFSLVLMLGGGPGVSTLEVAIYTSVRFDFDLPKAAILSTLQVMIAGGFILLLSRGQLPSWTNRLSLASRTLRTDAQSVSGKLADGLILGCFCLIVVCPLLALFLSSRLVEGVSLFERSAFWQAFWSSTSLGLSAALLSTTLAFILCAGRYRMSGQTISARFGRSVISLSQSVYLVLPAIVLGTASFLVFRPIVNLFDHVFFVVLLTNSLLALPFATRLIDGRYHMITPVHDKLCAQIDLTGWRRFFWVTLPAMRREVGLCLGLTAALSIGDFGVIALFGSEQFQTLPYLLYQYASRYGGAEAELLAVFLLIYGLGLFFCLHQAVNRLAVRRTYA